MAACEWSKKIDIKIPEIDMETPVVPLNELSKEKKEDDEVSWDDIEGIGELFEDIFKDF